MSMDFAYLKSHAPVVDEIMQILLAVGWALLIGNLVFQALKSMAVGLGFEGEDPKLLFARTFVFAFLLLASPQICEIGLSMTSKIIELLQIPDAVIAARDDSVLADKIAQLIIWFSLKKKDLSEEDKSRLDSSLVEVYKRYGITFDNSTIVDENGNFRTMPILSDWYEILYQEQDTRHLAVVLSRYVTGSAAAMAGRNDIELNNKYIVLDLSGMPDDMIADGTFWATSIAYDLIMNCEDELSALLADELWSLVGATANPQAAGFVLEMVKTIRGLGGIAVTSTQGMQDLFSLEGGSYGKGILDSSRIKLVMQMEEQEARLIQDKLNLSEDEVRQITRFRRGEGLLCIGYRGLHYPVHLLSCDETGARQLQIMAVPDYRMKLAKLMLRSAYRPPPEDDPAWDAIYQNRPFVIGADMNLRRIDAAIASAKKRGCLPISLAALDAQGDAVLLRRYKDTSYAVIYKVTESVLTELFGHPPSLYLPPCTQYLTKKGDVVDAPLIKAPGKAGGSPRK